MSWASEVFCCGIGLDALLRDEEGDDEEDHAHDTEQPHRELVAARVVALAEDADERDDEAGDDEAREVRRDLAVRGDARPLVRVFGHDGGQRGVRHVVDDVDDPQRGVGHPGVDHLGAETEVGRREGEDADDAEGQRAPQDPRPELAPLAGGPVGDHAHHRVEHGHAQADDAQHGPRLRRCEAEGVGVEVQLQRDHELEHEIGGHVAEGVADLLSDWEFLGHRLLFPGRAGLSAGLCGPVPPGAGRVSGTVTSPAAACRPAATPPSAAGTHPASAAGPPASREACATSAGRSSTGARPGRRPRELVAAQLGAAEERARRSRSNVAAARLEPRLQLPQLVERAELDLAALAGDRAPDDERPAARRRARRRCRRPAVACGRVSRAHKRLRLLERAAAACGTTRSPPAGCPRRRGPRARRRPAPCAGASRSGRRPRSSRSARRRPRCRRRCCGRRARSRC